MMGADNNNNHNSSSSEDYQKNIVPSIINGTWIKRRHGMNLEPLCMTYRGVHVEDDYIAAKRRRNTTEQQEGDDNNVQNNDYILQYRAKKLIYHIKNVQYRAIIFKLDTLRRSI